MKLVMEAADLVKALQAVVTVAARKTTLPILSNVHLEVTPDTVILTAFNLDQQAQVHAQIISVDEPGIVTTDAHALLAIVTRLPRGADVQLELDRATLVLTSGRTRCALKTLPPADWVMMGAEDDDKVDGELRLPAAALGRALGLVAHAISRSGTRPYLEGAHLEFNEAGDGETAVLHVAATDGHRMAVFGIEAASDFKSLTVPTAAVQDIIKLCGDGDGEAVITLWGRSTPSLIRVSVGPSRYASKLIEGDFVDWRRVLPTAPQAHAKFNIEAMVDAVDLVIAKSDQKLPKVELRLCPEGLGVALDEPGDEAQTMIDGTCEIESAVGATELSSCVNARYLTDALKALGKGEAELHLIDSMSPWLLTGSDSAYRQVMMPVVTARPRRIVPEMAGAA